MCAYFAQPSAFGGYPGYSLGGGVAGYGAAGLGAAYGATGFGAAGLGAAGLGYGAAGLGAATAFGTGLSGYPFGATTLADPFAQTAYAPTLGGYSTVPQFGGVFGGVPPSQSFGGKITLTYFPLKGLAEVIRLLLVEAQVPWDEVAVDNKEFWDQLKPTLTYSQVPILDIDGKRLYQSRAIANYLSRKFGFSGLNADEQYAVDEVLESLQDFRQGSPLFAIMRGEADAKEKLSKWKGEGLKKFTSIWIKKLQENVQGGGRHIVGASLTVADLALYVALRTWKEVEGMENYLEEFPALNAFVQGVEARPAIAAYYNSPRAHAWKPTEELRKKIREITGH